MRRFIPVVVLLASLTGVASAPAATISVNDPSQKVRVDGADGETNRIALSQIGDVVTIEDTGAPLTLDASATICAGGGGQVTCTLPTRSYRVQVDAGDGNDALSSATLVPALLRGGAGDDTLTGGDAADDLDGGEGADTLTGGAGADDLDGGDGDDVLRARDGTRDAITCGLGTDTGEADLEDAVTGDCPGLVKPLAPSSLVTQGGDGAGALPAELASAPTPSAGKSVSAGIASGSVRVKLPGAKGYAALDPTEPVPVGTSIDSRNGTVILLAAKDLNGGTQVAKFNGGIFTVAQKRAALMTTVLQLRGGDFSRCRTGPRTSARAAGSSPTKGVRRLWGSGHGRFTTRGRNSTATVRGTIWSVTDTCTSTITRVQRGAVAVRDLVRKRTKLVRAGQSYVARRDGTRR